jgi:hypothetical protein
LLVLNKPWDVRIDGDHEEPRPPRPHLHHFTPTAQPEKMHLVFQRNHGPRPKSGLDCLICAIHLRLLSLRTCCV